MKRKEKKESTKFKTTLKVLLILVTSLLICGATYGIYLTKKAENATIEANTTSMLMKNRLTRINFSLI